MDFKYTYEKTILPREKYGSRLDSVMKQFENRIVDFRPPRKGEIFVTVTLGLEGVADEDMGSSEPRFILCPPLRRITLVEVLPEGNNVLHNGDYFQYSGESTFHKYLQSGTRVKGSVWREEK